MLLEGYLIGPIYRYMAEIDWGIRGKGNPKIVGRKDVTDEIAEMVKFLDKCKDEMIQGIKVTDLASLKPAETERNAAPAKIIIKNFKGVLGDVQAETVQTGDYASIHKHPVTAEKKKGIFRRIPYWIYILICLFASLITILEWGPIKAFIGFIGKILWPK